MTAQGMVAPYATLDTSHIDDLRGQWTCPADEEIVLWPEGTVPETTPMVPVVGTCYVVPEEAPDGGHVLPDSAWLDDSPLYSDGWLLLVDDVQHVVRWRAPESIAGKPAAAVQHMVKHHGGTVRTEDGTRVPPSFYRHVSGPSTAVCAHLGKRRVPDARYGHRCVR